jgi:hypothetical protein
MPFSESFSQSFRHEPLSIKELTDMLNDVLGEWDVGALTQAFIDLGIWPIP